MKVALIGTHGVGKTTLCFELAARLKRRDVDVELVAEVARRCPLPINRQTSLAAQSWILHEQIAHEIVAEASHPVVICDRSVLDNYCYLLSATGPAPHFDPLINTWLKTYGLLVKVPILGPLRFDGVRDTNTAFQRAIDELLDSELHRRGLDCLRLLPEHRETWADEVMARLAPLVCPSPPLFPEDELDKNSIY